jgi:dTDP-4-dehydrorhamnose 3,5-epimerase
MEPGVNILLTKLSGVVIAESVPFVDPRGVFSRFYCERELAVVIGERRIVQVNHSRTVSMGTVRGLHYQRPPHMEMKLVRCLKGKVWDVAVDLRNDSPTFLQWYAEELTPMNARMLVIPEGCAHGFQVLEAETELLYLHTEFYMPEAEAGVRVDDPRLNIGWPLPIAGLSDRDILHPRLGADFSGLVI